jgi:hypothetical protein
MSIYMSQENIVVQSPSIYCDGCRITLRLVSELIDIKLEKSGDRQQGGFGGPIFVVPGIPRNEAEAVESIKGRGWKREIIHGKEMDFCPNCQVK